MPITHTNRQGDVYYLHQGETKTGKPRYFFSRKNDGQLAEAVPEGYEIYEKPSAQVFLRKIVPTSIRPEEVEVVRAGLRRVGANVFFLETEKNSIAVHAPSQTRKELERFAEKLGGWMPSSMLANELQSRVPFAPMLRFVLANEAKRHFRVQRWCFRGSVDGWIPLLSGPSGDLAKLVAYFGPHLEEESFFELM